MDMVTIGCVGAFGAIVVFLVFLRARTGGKFEIRTADITLALVPLGIFLLVTGRIQKFEFGELKVEAAIVEASRSAITSQVTVLEGLPIDVVEAAPKADVALIPQLVARETEALEFRLGHGGYEGRAITDYLRSLTRQQHLRYVVLKNEDSTFYAIANARKLTSLVLSRNPPYTAADLARWLNSSDRDQLEVLPGFLSAEQAAGRGDDKSETLERMDALDIETLPVIDERGYFVGVVGRSRLTASLILDIARQLGAAAPN